MPPLAPPSEENALLVCNTDLYDHDIHSMDVKQIMEDEDWCKPFIQHLMDRREPVDPVKCTKIRCRATRFTLQGNQLYWRSLDDILLNCLSIDEATKVMTKVHASMCGGHQSDPKL